MKKFFAAILSLFLIFSVGCSAEKNSEPVQNEAINMKIKILVGENVFTATLEDNPTAREFIKKLPQEIEMIELNGNEKYYKFKENFPTADKNIGEIHAGDLMIYNSSYVVLFYKNFSTNYKYTRLGKIDNPQNLLESVGHGNIRISFEK